MLETPEDSPKMSLPMDKDSIKHGSDHVCPASHCTSIRCSPGLVDGGPCEEDARPGLSLDSPRTLSRTLRGYLKAHTDMPPYQTRTCGAHTLPASLATFPVLGPWPFAFDSPSPSIHSSFLLCMRSYTVRVKSRVRYSFLRCCCCALLNFVVDL